MKTKGGRALQSEITYRYDDYLKDGLKFAVWRETVMNSESAVHKHNFLELIYIISGTATHYIDDVEYKVTKGDLLLIDTGRTHYHKSEGGVLYADMVLLPEFISENLRSNHSAIDVFAYYLYNSELSHQQSIPETPLIRFTGNDLIAADAIVNAMCEEMLNRGSGYAEILSSYLDILFHMIIRNIENSRDDKVMHDIRDLIPGIIDYIEVNCNSQITLGEMAKKYFYSPAYFSRAFKKHFGTTFSQYLQSVRIQKVIQLMQDSSLSIEEISEMIGYHDKRELYRAFKNVTGTTPSNYRKTKMQ